MNLKSLAKDTALYGLSSIVGRFLNYLLVPVYTYYIAAESGGYGIVTNLYAYTALLLALLTFGMETTLFRFGSKPEEDDKMVYSTTLRMVGFVCFVFIAIVLGFLKPIAGGLGYAAHPEYIGCMALIVAQDAFQAIMFSRLRQQQRPVRFVILKFAFIIPNILLNLFLFILLPKFFPGRPALEAAWQHFDYGVGFIFLINLICTTLVSLLFLKEIKGIFYGWDSKLARRMLKYTWPLLLLGLVGILNQVADKILFPWLVPGPEGNGVRIDNLCQIAHNVIIGDNTVMAAQTGIAGSTEIGKNCMFGGQVGLVGHIKIADNTMIGAQSGVTRSVRKSGTVIMGTPAIEHNNYLRSYAKFKQAGQE
jgi:O-antigen/teichoic acid export membrane protein